MTILLLGLAMFIAAHSVRLVADGWRMVQIARLGPGLWKGLYSLISFAGLALIVWGYGATRGAAELWQGPGWLKHAAAALMLASFILFAAVYVPRNHVRAFVGHPMTAGVTIWALAHLLTNTRPGDLVLFGAFLAWSALVFRAARRRDSAAGGDPARATWTRTATTVLAGAVVWAVFTRYLHPILTGVPAF